MKTLLLTLMQKHTFGCPAAAGHRRARSGGTAMISTRYPALLGRAVVALALVTAGLVVTADEASAIIVTRVSTTSASTSTNKSVTATCPDGQNLIGTGGRVIGGGGEVLITDIVPSSSLRSVTVAGGENGPYPETWQVGAVAVCSSAASNLSRVSATSEDNGTSDSPKSAQVFCPDGQVALGMGYQLSGAAGNIFPNLLTPVGSPPDLVVVSAFEDLPYAPSWNLQVYAICGDVSGDVVVEFSSVGSDSDSPKSATASCPPGMVAVSAGGDNGGQVSGHADDLIIERMTPDVDLAAATTRVAENDGLGTDWSVTAYTICVD